MGMGTGQNGTWILADSVRRALATRTRTTDRPSPTPRHSSAAAGRAEVASNVVIAWFLCSRHVAGAHCVLAGLLRGRQRSLHTVTSLHVARKPVFMTQTQGAALDRGAERHRPAGISAGLTLLLATSCGLIVAGLYFSQPLIQLIGPQLGFAPWTAGLIVTLTQLGYGAGLLLVTPLGDMVENRRLVLVALCCNVAALVLAAVAPNSTIFLAAFLLVGVTAVAVQILVPLAAHLAPLAVRGRVVGNVMSGLLLGILLGRPLAS